MMESLERLKSVKLTWEGYEPFVLKGLSQKMPLMSNCVFIVEVSPNYLERIGFTKAFIYDFFDSFGFSPTRGISTKGQYNEVFRK